MADKRNSIAGKVATPNLKVGGGPVKDVSDVDSNLYKAVGSRYDILLCGRWHHCDVSSVLED